MDGIRTPFYRRNLLDGPAIGRYDRVVEAVRLHEAILPDDLTDAWPAVTDHPELFWTIGTLMSSGDDDAWRIQYYSLTAEQIARMQAEIDAAAEKLLAHAPWDGSEWDRALYVYETMAELVRYQEDEEGIAESGPGSDGTWDNGRDFSRTIYGPLVLNWGVCSGYASAYQYLVQRLGVECLRVGNGIRGSMHSWNLVRMEGEYSFVDATFARSWGTREGMPQYAAHEFFGMELSDDERAELYFHIPSKALPLPERTTSNHDWFKRTGRFIAEFDPAFIDEAIARTRAEEAAVLELKCVSDEIRNQTEAYLAKTFGLACDRHHLRVLAAAI